MQDTSNDILFYAAGALASVAILLILFKTFRDR